MSRVASRTILLRSGWQAVNIGDIAHTPGVLGLLRRHVPEAHVVLWPNPMGHDVEAMLSRLDPGLEILDPSKPGAVEDAVRRADLFLHGSGPGLVGRRELSQWRDLCDKPFGVFGITLENPDSLRDLLRGAAFIFTRETASLERVCAAEIRCGIVDFAPDGTFALRLPRNDTAERTLREHRLEPGRFLCVVPRLRYTPYHLIHPHLGWDENKIRSVTEHNARFVDADHAKLREAVIAYVRRTGHRVLACPEMTYQVDLLRPHVVNPLPDDVRPHVASLDRYWLTDEAAGVYAQASAVVSLECHSPIIAIAHAVPALYVRQPEDTIKGRMYSDLGLERWKLDVDATSGDELAGRVIELVSDPSARSLAEAARDRAAERCATAMRAVREAMRLPSM